MPSSLPTLIAVVALFGTSSAAAGGGAADGAGDPLAIEVMSFNLRWGPDREPNTWAMRRGRVVELIREEAPAVVGLQESRAEYLDALLARLPEYAAYPSTGNLQNSILYCKLRLQIDAKSSDADNARVDAPAADWGQGSVRLPRSARLVDDRSGRAFYVYNNHFDHRSAPSRLWSAGVLLDRIRARPHADPVILTGDFNAEEGDPAIALLRGGSPPAGPATDAAEPFRFVDSFRELHPDKFGVGTYHGFLGMRIGPRIDYIFAGPGIRVKSARILRFEQAGHYPSDHFPVTATLLLEATDAMASASNRQTADAVAPHAAARIASGECPLGVSP